MKAIGSQIVRTVLDNSISIFLTIALFVSYIFILSGLPATLPNYLSTTALICLLYWPIMGFALFRKYLIKSFPNFVAAGIWLICFLIYPILLITSYKKIEIPDTPFFKPVLEFGILRFLISAGLTFLLTEIVLQFHFYRRLWTNPRNWLQKINLEQGILAVCLLLALLLGFIGLMEVEVSVNSDNSSGSPFLVQIFQLVSFTFQFFLILLAYYFFYYCNHYFLIRVILKEKGIIYYGFSIAAMVLVCYPILISMIRYLPIVKQLSIGIFSNNQNLFAGDGGGLPFTIMILSAPIIISNQWFRQHRAIAELEKEKTEGELDLLKQQINPHFFFNTLNSLYALSLTRDKATPEMILQLSELMRYVIYRCREESVSLEEEINYIKDYIQLQRLRMYRKLDFRFDIQIKDQAFRIPPLLFIILVENAFKHGIEPAESDSFLHLCLECNDEHLIFSCENSVAQKQMGEKGIGLKNLKRRLALLYPQRHELIIREDGNKFIGIIKLDL